MGLSSSKSTQTSSSNQTQNATTTPQNPSWVTDSLTDYTGRIGSMLDADPNAFVAAASPLQQQAWGNADRLGLWTGNANAASNIALDAANAPASNVPGAAGYGAARGNASTWTPAALANPREVGANGYSAAQAGRVGIDPVANGRASDAHAASLLSGFADYMNPYRDQVVNSAMADFDRQAGQQRAALEAQGARNGAFGGSRFGIAQAELEGNLARARSSSEAGLLSDGFDRAAGLSQFDAANRQQASLFNAQNRTGVSTANAAAANQRALSQAQLDAQTGLANADARSQAAQFGAAAQNAASLANQGASNQFALAQAGMQNDASRYAADAHNELNRDYLTRADQAAQFGASAENAANLFNAQQREAGLNRQLTAASALNGFGSDYGANTRADLGALASLGDAQRQVEQAYALAPLAQLQAGGQLFGATPFQLFTGQNVASNGTSSGTGTTISTPSLFSQLLAAASVASSFVPK
ncbi:MAG: hypothetical protein QOH81_967 [Sphingomonadales bacterium]|jgi:hypothetical protein|nr:hypothetical protein [Sphingomonadales bacterium]